jgi:CubicO group peptidase (beta-lactamase class C family)
MAEGIGGDSWERLVKKYIFDPLGMTSSSFMTTYDNNKLYSHPSRGGTATTWCDKVCFTSAILVSSISKTNHYYININEILSKVTLRNNNSLNISSKGRVMLPLQNICHKRS